MDDDLDRFAETEQLYRLLDHYRKAAGEDRTTWADRVMAWEGGSPADLTRWHGALLAAAWVEINPGMTPGAGVPAAGGSPGKVPGSYRLTPAGRQALKKAQATAV